MLRKIGLLITLTKQYQERILTSLLVKYGIDRCCCKWISSISCSMISWN